MNKFLLFTLLLVGSVGAFAQNKTLGVGTATPNPNAALHVESPTNNQGFIMPRMTTALRGAISGLSATDIGLMVYDTDLSEVYIWDGTAWGSASTPSLPHSESTSSAAALLDLTNTGTGGAISATSTDGFTAINAVYSGPSFGGRAITGHNTSSTSGFAGEFRNFNAANTFPAIQAQTEGTGPGVRVIQAPTSLGLGMDVWMQNTTSTQPGIFVDQKGLGNGGRFIINNVANGSSAIYASTVGSGGVDAAAIFAETATAFSAITARGTGAAANALTGIITDPGAGGYAVLGSVSAVGGGQAGVFTISNTANPNNTLEATTSGTGGAAKFKVANPASTKTALWSETNSNQPLSAAVYGLNTGTGDAAGVFRINNAASAFEGVFGETNGTGSAIMGNQLGMGRAGTFQIVNATNAQVSLRATTTGVGRAGYFQINNASDVNNDAILAVTNSSGANSSAIRGDHNGTSGYAGIFQNINGANGNAALFAESGGTGPSIWALKTTGDVSGDALLAENWLPTGSAAKFVIADATNPNPTIIANTNSTANGSAILATNTGVGDAVFATANSGSGGNFQNSNPSNNASIVFAMSNAQNGHSIGAMNTAEGSAFSIFQGGMKLSTFEVTTGTTIATRAAAYRITSISGTSFTITFPSGTGDMYMVYNDTGAGITFEGVAIPSGTGKIVINFNSGSFRGL